MEFCSLEADARAVLTDSGGIQEETTFLGVPCFTLRDNTERPITVTHGTNTLLGLDPARIADVLPMLDRGSPAPSEPPPLWDGRAGERVAAVVAAAAATNSEMMPRLHPMTDRLNSAAPRLAVVVPATDGPASLDRCLGSIAAAADGPEELIVVDQPGLTVVDARNHGAFQASAEVLVFIDSDVLVHGDAFTRIRQAFCEDPHLTGVIGAYDDSPTAPGTVSGFRNLLHHSVGLSAPGPVATFWTGLGAVRNDVVRSGRRVRRRAPLAARRQRAP